MKLQRSVFGVLGIRAGEGRRVAWLIVHSLFIGVFSAFYLTASNALFLDRFESSFLPVAYIAAAAVGYLALMLFSRLQKAVSLKRALLANLACLLAVVAALWLLALSTPSRWVAFFMFVWVGPAFSLLALGYWALAGRLFDLRQGKRLFGLVGAGEEVTTVIGLFSVPLLVRWLGGPLQLLPIALAGLVGCLAIVAATGVQFREELSAGRAEANPAAESARRSGLRELLGNRYFLLLASLIVFLTLANYLVDFGFLSQVRTRFQGSTQLAQFLGVFFGITKILELLAKVFLSGRLLNQFGLKFGLLAVPVLLAACAGFAIAIGTLGLPLAHFFVLVALAKLVWIVSRTTTFEPSFRVLYQPVGAARLAFQTHAEGTTRQLTVGVVGVALLLWSRSPSFNTLTLFYVLAPLLLLWMAVSGIAHREYRARLLESLRSRSSRQAPLRPLDVLYADLHAEDPRQQQHAVSLLRRLDGAAFGLTLAELLADPDPRLRVLALEHVGRERLADLHEWAAGCAGDPEPTVRAAARQALDRLREADELAAGRVEALASSSVPDERALAAEGIGRGAAEAGEKLWMLLFDPDWAVRRAALTAAGRLGRAEFWPQIIGELDSPVLSRSAVSALVALGERALPEAERAFNKAEQRPAVRQRLLRIYETIGGSRACALLLDKLAFPDEAVRAQALSCLARTGHRADAGQSVAASRAIEALVARSAWNMSAALDLGDDERLAPVVRALDEEIEAARSNLFLLLALFHDPWAIGLVRENLASGASETTAYALEILDILLSDELKQLAFPMLEGLAYAQTLRRLEAPFPRHRMTPQERLSAIVNRDFDRVGIWTRACALEAAGHLAGSVIPDLVASLFHPHPLMQDVAGLTLRQLDPQAYERHRAKLGYDARERLDYVMGPDGTQAHWSSRSVFGRSQLLRGLPAFSHLPSQAIVRLALASDDLVLNQRRRLPSPRAPEDSFYVNLEGDTVLTEAGNGPQRSLPLLSLIGFGPGARSLEVRQTARFVRIDPEPLFELAVEHVSLISALQRAERQVLEEPAASAPGGPAEAAEAVPI